LLKENLKTEIALQIIWLINVIKGLHIYGDPGIVVINFPLPEFFKKTAVEKLF
jgi:hypothetical protein